MAGELYAKLAEVVETVDTIPERGRNTQQGYSYVTDEDLVRAVRKELAKRKIVLLPSVRSVTTDRDYPTKGGGKQTVIRVEGVWTFVDGESGERHEVPMVGEGADSGDKGVYKAYTGALKYVIRQSFLIPTGDDPEKDPPAGDEAAATVAANGASHAAAYPLGPAPQNERISEGKARRAFALRKQHKWEDHEWARLLDRFEVHKADQLSFKAYDDFCAYIERKKQLPPETDVPADVDGLEPEPVGNTSDLPFS